MFRRLLLFAFAGAALTVPAAAKDRQPPYWASIDSGKVRMRTGPSLDYPATWLYRRAELPIRIVGTYPGWRKVQDLEGTTGWMRVGLLSDTRTAIVARGVQRILRNAPSDNAAPVYRVGSGVIGRVSKCKNGWCKMDVKGRGGFIRTREIWGVDPLEELD